jgi:uncharacterized 2Fe-2S/4Fe-4S cluster protein (DUF4445 family)
MRHRPFVFSLQVKLIPPSTDDKDADADRLRNGLEEIGIHNVEIPLHILRKLSDSLRDSSFEVKPVLGTHDERYKLIDLEKGLLYGIALDIGTTSISCSLFDLGVCKKVGTYDIENPQIRYGTDVLARAQRSLFGDSDSLTNSLIEGINGLIKTICERNSIGPDEIYGMVVSGNTIMSHYLLGLDVRNIPVAPFIPSINRPVFASAGETGIDIYKDASVYVFPNSGSYVGGDIISGILCSGIQKEKEPALFIDVGTNAELALGCRDWIIVGAGAAGPALEDGVAEIGKKAEKGSIYGVRICPDTKTADLRVIGDSEPEGICGSGMIDLVSELFSAGIIDQAGKFMDSGGAIKESNGEKVYMLCRTEGREMVISESEIQNFLRSKAAMFAFLYVFVKAVGMRLREIQKVFVGGSMGCGINLENAIKIGMLPDLPRERFISLGNSSLCGAEMVLCNSNMLDEIESIRSKITYREMGEDSELLGTLQGGLFIPHTEPEILKG